ncbi:hypothetical protein R3P38DRAFT_3383365 [Favolaschia claudopus]|uniref:Uncharacterized protein n=1 Tax=Favolaschia claudopus TaxID=2862362 RepID=A0AAW0EKW6_9AGAR
MPSRTRSSDLSLSSTSTMTSGPSKQCQRVLRATIPEPEIVDMDMDVDENNATLVHEQLGHLDDPWPTAFQPNQKVWIRNHGKWIRGKIFPQSVPKLGISDNLTYWNVMYKDTFGHHLRKSFAPLAGELKPDIPAVRKLLREAHWL